MTEGPIRRGTPLMSSSVITCPHCFTPLRGDDEQLRGKRVKCPKCARPFMAPRGRQDRAPARGGSGIAITVILALLVLTGGTAAGVYFLVNGGLGNGTQAQV